MSTCSPITQADRVIGVICRKPMEEVVRRTNGADRWCFHCRKVRSFDYVVTAPVEPSYYGPNPSIRCAVCNTVDGDCFPGRYREWDEAD